MASLLRGKSPHIGTCRRSLATPGDRCPRAAGQEQRTTDGLYPNGICEISPPIDQQDEKITGPNVAVVIEVSEAVVAIGTRPPVNKQDE